MGHRFRSGLPGPPGHHRASGARRAGRAAVVAARSAAATAESLPTRLSDEAFWHLITDFSEPNGFFRSDNFLSNEQEYQWVIPTLTSTLGTGGVYLGVGPEQNFSYIVALRPKLAFIVDIRRGNRDLHLLYKAFIEMSADRAEFLSRLFARPRPAEFAAWRKTGDERRASCSPLTSVRRPARSSSSENLRAATEWLQRRHSFALSDDEVAGLEYVYRAFFEGGPDLNYSFPNGGFGRGGNFPTYAELMTADRRRRRASQLSRVGRPLPDSRRAREEQCDHTARRQFRRAESLARGGQLPAPAQRHRLGVLYVECRDVSLPAGGRLEKVLRQRRGFAHRRKEHVYPIGVEPGFTVPDAKQRAGRQGLDASQFNRRSRPRLSRGPDRRLLRRDCDVAVTTSLRIR